MSAEAGSKSTAKRAYELWRQDDNGNTFLVIRYATRAEAERRQRVLEAGGHKQLYWIREVRRDD